MDGRKTVVLPVEEIAETIRTVLSQGGTFDLTVTGYSMSPTLQPGRDAVRLAAPGRIRRGDILFAGRLDGGFLLHRVLRSTPNGYVLNGDGQQWVEEVSRECVLGVVIAIRHKKRWISVKDIRYRLYVRLWGLTRPFRDGLVKIKRKLSGDRRK